MYSETLRHVNWFKYRLQDKSLIESAIYVPYSYGSADNLVNIAFDLAVPVGGRRISGQCYSPTAVAFTIMEEMSWRPNEFPNPVFRVNKTGKAGEISWGVETKPFWGQRRVLGNMFGYSDSAINQFCNGDYHFGKDY